MKRLAMSMVGHPRRSSLGPLSTRGQLPEPLLARVSGLRALVFLALMLAAPQAQAELVTHQFTGQLTTVTNGSGVTLDLTGLFTLGQAVTFEYTIERDTPADVQDPYTSAYTGAVTALAFSIESWSGSGAPDYSLTTVKDNAPSPAPGAPRTLAVAYDQYSGQVQGGISAPPVGDAMLQSLTYTFDDVQGTVFNSTVIPRVFPDLGEFEGKTLTILFFDFTQLKSGYVMATLAGGLTPTQATTWGGLKALHR